MKLREYTARAILAPLTAKRAARHLRIENEIRTHNRFDIAERIPLMH